MAKSNPKLLVFGHRKLSTKARSYRNEVSYLTYDMLHFVKKSSRSLAICDGIVSVLGSKKHYFRIDSLDEEAINFKELLFNIENFNFRLHAYRDKLCIFLNYVMGLGYDAGDTDLLNKLMRHGLIKKSNIATELKKLQTGSLNEALQKRKLMSHRIYYNELYNPMFMPDDDPSKIGFYKAASKWRTKMKKEVSQVDDCMSSIFDINSKITEKLIKYLNG